VGAADLVGRWDVNGLEWRLVASLDGRSHRFVRVDAVEGIAELAPDGLEDVALPGDVHLLGTLAAHLVGDQSGEVPALDDCHFSPVFRRGRDRPLAENLAVAECRDRCPLATQLEDDGLGVSRPADQTVVARALEGAPALPALHTEWFGCRRLSETVSGRSSQLHRVGL
jgi:hypothetical protein